MSFSDNERDDFWDIDKLIPKKKNNLAPFSTGVRVREYHIEGTADESDSHRKLTGAREDALAPIETFSYVPENSSLIKKVTISKVADKYDFYENFRKAALVYYDFKTQKCDFAPYYSYMPQYSQLTSDQKRYYFYWRDQVRQGKYIKSDYSYLYLYIYEILNLPDKVSPKEGIVILCRLWQEYRKVLPKMDSYFAIWIQDYCLVHKTALPMVYLRDFIYRIISITEFPEFYLSDIDFAGESGTEALLLYLSDYDWRRGKFASGENSEIYRNYMLGAMKSLFDRVLSSQIGTFSGPPTVITRSAFPHSLCTHAVKCSLTIEYIPLAKDVKLRTSVTEAVRYAENKLRAVIGIKSRLGIKNLPDEYRAVIDSYFTPIIEQQKYKNIVVERPEYEKLYDAPREKLSLAGADELELASWTTTARLVADETENSDEETDETDATVSVCSDQNHDCGDEKYGLDDADVLSLRSILEVGTADDSLAERINEAFSDGFGDVILEHNGEKYIVIEDYREEIDEWLSKQGK